MNQGLFSFYRLFTRFRIILGLLVIVSCACLFIVLSSSFSPSFAQNRSAVGQLAGQWHIAFPTSPIPFTLVVAPEGKLFLLSQNSSGSTAYEIARKISDVTALPPNTQIVSLEEIINSFLQSFQKARETEARQSLSAMNKGQQAYYLEFGKFGNTIDELGIGIRPETDNYRYQIVPQADQTQSVMMTAQTKKPELKSYTGAVFAIKVKEGDVITIAGICETDKPSSTPPGMPKPPRNPSEKIECPTGSNLLER